MIWGFCLFVCSFVADNSLLDRCDLGFLFVCLSLCFSTLYLVIGIRQSQVGNHLGFWGGFSCFVSFIWCQLFAWLIKEAIFCLPPAFVVCSYFLCGLFSFFATGICVRSLSFMAFSAKGIRVRLFVSQFLISCCALAVCQLHQLEIWTGFFCKLVTLAVDKFCFEANRIWYSAIKFMKSHSAKCLLHKWAWLRRSIKVSSFELYKFDPFLPHSGLIPRELMHSYALGCLWVVTVCCHTVDWHGRAFCWPHAYTFNEQSKMATAQTPQTDITSKRVTWLMENLRQQSQPAYRK